MYIIEKIILILLFSVVSVPIANRFRVPLEVFLLVGGCAIGMTLQLHYFDINPVIVFNIFLPIILFYAAYFSSFSKLKSNKNTVSLLSIGLVAFTMCAVALITKFILPAFSWAECFLLGAIISPTDASAATSIIKKLNAPRYIINILEAESLLNDASALILFKFALIATATATFSISETTTQFIYVTLGGITIGILVGLLTLFLLLRIPLSAAKTTLTFVTAISSYMIGEYFAVSGVVATVTCGLIFGLKLPELNTSDSRVEGKSSWDTLIFIINCMAFMLIGLELPVIIKDIPPLSTSHLIVSGAVITIIIFASRIFWVFMCNLISRSFYSFAHINKMTTPIAIQFLIGWSGMRGIISLAAVLSIPALIPSNDSIPHLDTILFITYFVIAATLIIPSLSLPLFVSIFRLQDNFNIQKEEATSRLHALKLIYDDLDHIAIKESIPEDTLNAYKKKINSKINMIETQLENNKFTTVSEEYRNLQKMTLSSIDDERKILLNLRRTGEVQDETFNKLFEELDREEIHAKTLRL